MEKNPEHSKTKLTPGVRALASISSVIALFVASYFSFSSYQPKALTEVREVKGYATKNTSVFDLPVPRYAKALANDRTLNSKKFTFETDKTPKEVYDFYKVILLEDDWKIKKEGNTDDFYTAEFKKDDYSVTVWASYDSDVKLTFASVEILDLEE
jgi:hypothetical protein